MGRVSNNAIKHKAKHTDGHIQKRGAVCYNCGVPRLEEDLPPPDIGEWDSRVNPQLATVRSPVRSTAGDGAIVVRRADVWPRRPSFLDADHVNPLVAELALQERNTT